MLRGINRQQVFNDDEDNEAFVAAMERFFCAGGHKLYAYCLMGNHVHILMREGKEPLGSLMRKVETSYAHWYNTKYMRTGTIFQGRYKSEPIENAEHLIRAVRYIHMNPVKAALCATPGEYAWSSYRAYQRNEEGLIRMRDVLAYADREALLALKEEDFFALAEPGEPAPGLTDAQAREIIREISGCSDASEFSRLNSSDKSRGIRTMFEKGLNASQICRLTGTSYALARKYQG